MRPRTLAQLLIVLTFVLVIGVIHVFQAESKDPSFHMLHQQLFYLPLIFSGFWFGLRSGIVVAAVIGMVYGLPLYLGGHSHAGNFIIFIQIVLYFLIAGMTGYLADIQNQQQQRLLTRQAEANHARAASTLSVEIQDIVRRIRRIYADAGGLNKKSLQVDMEAEISRLEHLLSALSQFSPSRFSTTLSEDLNEMIRSNLPSYQREAERRHIKILLKLSQTACSTVVKHESIPRILHSLVSNAIEFSPEWGTVTVQSKVKGGYIELAVHDNGSGVAKEHESKLFRPYFTTKRDGYGLSLSSGSKVLRDLGGELRYERRPEGGATFVMSIPRGTAKELLDAAG